MRGARRAAALGGALAMVFAAPAPAATSHAPALDRVTWEVPTAARSLLELHVQRAPAIARRLARRLAPMLTVRRIPGSRSRAVLVTGAGAPRFVLELHAAALRSTHRGRMTFLHELGHVVDWAFVDDALGRRFREAFAASVAARPCFAHGTGCVSDSEVFAEQFAFWAGARRTLRSGYGVPPLLSRRAFDELMSAAGWSPEARVRLVRAS